VNWREVGAENVTSRKYGGSGLALNSYENFIRRGNGTMEESRKGMGQRYCRKCLLREMDEREYFANLYEYIEHLDEDLKVGDALYEKRLAVCKECDSLWNGMCRICGCYVELRAVMKKNSCPGLEKKWEAAE
jgi:hypothetical protein